MKNCYICGCSITNGQNFRRKVIVNESVRIYVSRKTGGSYGQNYALRTVCASCASQIDSNNKELSWRIPISLIFGFLGFLIAVRWANSNSETLSALHSFLYMFLLFGGLGIVVYFLLGFFVAKEDKVSNEDLYE